QWIVAVSSEHGCGKNFDLSRHILLRMMQATARLATHRVNEDDFAEFFAGTRRAVVDLDPLPTYADVAEIGSRRFAPLRNREPAIRFILGLFFRYASE